MIDNLFAYYTIKQFDIFGTQISLNYKKDHQFRTPCGGLTTVFCIFVVTILCYSTISTLFEKTQVTYVTSVNYSPNPSQIEVNSNRLMIAVQYDQTNFLAKPMVNITFQQSMYHRFSNGTLTKIKTPINLEPCTLSHFSSLPSYNYNWTDAFYSQNIQDFLCLPKNKSLYLRGVFENEDFNFIKFTVTKCVNSTADPNKLWNPTCEQPSVIAANQNEGSRVRFLVSSNDLNPEKADDSITSFLWSQIFNVQQDKMYTTANAYINTQNITTDESITPLKSKHEETLLQFMRSETWQQVSVGSFSNFCEIFFLRSNYSTTSTKSFLKFDSVISYIGGFCQVFFLISAFLVRKYNTYIMYNELANRLYDFEVQNKTKDPKTKNKNKNQSPMISQKTSSQTQLQQKSALRVQSDVLQDTNQQTINNSQKQNSEKQQHLSIEQISSEGKNQQMKDSPPPNERDELTFVPFDQIRRVLTEKGIGQSYYTTDYFPEIQNNSNNQSAQKKDNQVDLSMQNHDYKIEKQPSFGNNHELTKVKRVQSNFFSQKEIEKETSSPKLNKAKSQKELLEEQDDKKEQIQLTNPLSFRLKNDEQLKSGRNILQNSTEVRDQLKTQRSASRLILTQRDNDAIQTQTTRQEKKETNSFGLTPRNYVKSVSQKQSFRGQTTTTQFLEKELKLILDRDRSLWINLQYFVNVLTCGKFFNTPQVKLLNKSLNLIKEDLDIFTILDRQKEVNKLKSILLNEDQQVLFNFFQKPLIKIHDDENILNLKQLKQDEKDMSRSITKLQKSQKKLNISFKNIGTIAKAVVKLKKGSASAISNYQKLFNHYQKLACENKLENTQGYLNQQLIDLLGYEMKHIFEIANSMQQKQSDGILSLQSSECIKKQPSLNTEKNFTTMVEMRKEEQNLLAKIKQTTILLPQINEQSSSANMEVKDIESNDNKQIDEGPIIKFSENSQELDHQLQIAQKLPLSKIMSKSKEIKEQN